MSEFEQKVIQLLQQIRDELKASKVLNAPVRRPPLPNVRVCPRCRQAHHYDVPCPTLRVRG